MLNEFARKLIELGASGQALDYLMSGYRNATPGLRTELNYTYDTGIQNRGGLTGGVSRGVGGGSSYRYDAPAKRGSRFERRGAGVEYKAEGGEVSPEERYGTIKSPDYPILAKGAELFRDVERRVKGSPAEFFLPGSGIAQLMERKAYGEDPSALEYGMAAIDAADVTPVGKFLAGVLPAGKKMADYLERGFIGIDTKRVDPGEIDRFDPDIGQGSRRGTGTFVSLSTDQAATYAPKVGGAVMPVRVDANDFPEVDFHGTGWNDPNGKRTLLDPETQEEIADLSGMDTNQIARHVREMGFPGVRMLDVVDPGPHRTGLSEGAFEEYFRTGDTQLVVFDPDRIVFEKQSTPVKKANGGGIAALAPRATGMFNGPKINKGVGAYAPLTRRRA